MKEKNSFYILRDKESGEFVYEDVGFSFQGGDIELCRVDNPHKAWQEGHVQQTFDIAMYEKECIESRYNVDVEVVHMLQKFAYKELEKF